MLLLCTARSPPAYHGDLYAELHMTSSEESSDESLYRGSASGESADEAEVDMDIGNTDSSHAAGKWRRNALGTAFLTG